jgi:para-nitrobenzyl esterase
MTIVETANGKVEGNGVDGFEQFLGIPYAAAPTGALRFRRPEPHPGWGGIRDTTTHGSSSLQPGTNNKPVRGQEDCLYLSVYTPGTTGGPRPTMVWFHGGAFTQGAGWLAEFDGSQLARTRDVVVVTCNYRLGVLGWLYSSDLGSSRRVDANVGLFDQIAVLGWVRDNISNFGGDPTNVTAFGQSAGAIGIVAMTTMPEARGLFHRAIAQSGAADAMLTRDEASEVAAYVLEELGETDPEKATPPQIVRAQRRAHTRFAWANSERPMGQRLLAFGPVMDGSTLRSRPLDHLELDDANSVPLISGTNRDEWRYFASMLPSAPTEAQMIESLKRWAPDADAFWNVYRAQAETPLDAWIDLETDRLFRIPSIRLNEAWAARLPGATFQYELQWRPPGSTTGATHGREIPFVFGTLDHPRGRMLGGASPPASLTRSLQHAWTSFARTGAPSSIDDDVVWPAYGPERKTLLFDATCTVVDDPDAARRELWDDIGDP